MAAALLPSREEFLSEVAIPGSWTCIFVSGSIVAGWGHANSDLDIYVVTDKRLSIPSTAVLPVGGITPADVPVLEGFVDDRRWDVELWLEDQVEQVLSKVTAVDMTEGGTTAALSPEHIDFLYRISIGVALDGAEWLAEKQRILAESQFRVLLAGRAFNDADGWIDDAVGLLQSSDPRSAVLAAREAFTLVVDGLLASHGEFAPNHKWRAQKMLRARPDELRFEEYWAIETMRGLDPDDPSRWVVHVLEVCQRLMSEVDLG